MVNCSSFATQEAAQESYDRSIANEGFDVDGLDNDDDGCACEHLPLEAVSAETVDFDMSNPNGV